MKDLAALFLLLAPCQAFIVAGGTSFRACGRRGHTPTEKGGRDTLATAALARHDDGGGGDGDEEALRTVLRGMGFSPGHHATAVTPKRSEAPTSVSKAKAPIVSPPPFMEQEASPPPPAPEAGGAGMGFGAATVKRKDEESASSGSKTPLHAVQQKGPGPGEGGREEPCSLQQQLDFERNGHVAVQQLFSESEVTVYFGEEDVNDALREGLEEGSSETQVLACILEQIPNEEMPFLQLFNLFRLESGLSPTGKEHQKRIREFALGERLGALAASLLGCDAVRIYQDSLFVKRPQDGPTPWHSDLNMAPLDSNSFLTFWIPLATVPEEGTALIFASGSHKDFALNHWASISHDRSVDLSSRYEEQQHGAIELGDCTAHHGWVLHSAPGNDLRHTRTAYTVSFIADGARTLHAPLLHADPQSGSGPEASPDNEESFGPDPEDSWSYRDWLPDVEPGEAVNHPFLPVVYRRGGK